MYRNLRPVLRTACLRLPLSRAPPSSASALANLLQRPGSISFRYNSSSSTSTSSASSSSTTPNSEPIGRTAEPKLQMTFTCTAPATDTDIDLDVSERVKCGERSTHTFTKQAYEKGIVLIQCPGCKNRCASFPSAFSAVDLTNT